MTALAYPVFDADNHYYESPDAFTRHIPKKMAARCVQWAEIDGRTRLLVGGKVSNVLPNPLFDPVAKPGCLFEYFKGENPEGLDIRALFGDLEPIRPEYRSREVRLQVLDEQGVDKVLLFPTLGVVLEQHIEEDPEACVAAFHAFNEWILDDWGFDYEGRMFSAAYLTLADADAAVAEVEWAIAHGVKLVDVRAAPPPVSSGATSPADPIFDPVWARLEEAGVLVCTHSGSSTRWFADRWEGPTQPTGFRVMPLRWMLNVNRDVTDFFAVVISHGLFARFPRLRMMSVENGAGWVGPLKKLFKKAYGQNPTYFAENPIDTFDQHVWVTPFWEDPIDVVVADVPGDRIAYGSDWPHAEGTQHPLDYLDTVAGLDDALRRRIVHDNVLAALGG